MKVVCAWCEAEIRATPDPPAVVSHGMCADCARFLRANRPGRTLREFLDDLPVPVLAVNANARVEIANSAAGELLGRRPGSLEGLLGGDAIECAYARRPEGCGRTVHCPACTIRKTVVGTYETGRPRDDVLAVQQIRTPEGPQAVRFRISTRKQGEVVLLRIDETGPVEGERAE